MRLNISLSPLRARARKSSRDFSVHDSTAEVDLNVVMTDDGRYVELQGTAEHKPFTEKSLDDLRALARKGLKEIFKRIAAGQKK